MRKGFIFVLLLIFNFLLIYGINYTNSLMEKNNFMIYFKEKPITKKDEDEKEGSDTPESDDYDGETADTIGKKMDKVFKETLLEGYGEYIATTSIKKSVNPYLIGGIILESTSCKTECTIVFKQCHNVGGIKDSPGCFGGSYKTYKKVDESIYDLIDRISKKYPTAEDQDINKMFKSYGKNATWAFKVNKYMDAIKRAK